MSILTVGRSGYSRRADKGLGSMYQNAKGADVGECTLEPLHEIRNRLKKYPAVRIKDEGDRIEVLPNDEDGFAVSIYHHGNEFTVGFGGWHDTFSDPERALECFAFGLSADCRLLVTCRGSFEYRWIVERLTEGVWTKIDEVGLLVPVPFWRRKTVKIRRNRLLGNDTT